MLQSLNRKYNLRQEMRFSGVISACEAHIKISISAVSMLLTNQNERFRATMSKVPAFRALEM